MKKFQKHGKTSVDLFIVSKNGKVKDIIPRGYEYGIHTPKIKITQNEFTKTSKGDFIKLMNENELEISFKDRLKNYPEATVSIFFLKEHLMQNTNYLIKDSFTMDKYRMADLAREMNKSKQTASTYFKALQEIDVLAEVDTERGKYWMVNPDFMFNGKEIKQSIYNKFFSACKAYHKNKTK